jgi:purine nucleosidase
MLVDVELNGALTRGQTVVDRRRTAEHLHNAQVCMSVDRARFAANFLTAIKGLERVQ